MEFTCAWERMSGKKLRELAPTERLSVLITGAGARGTLDFREAVRLCRPSRPAA